MSPSIGKAVGGFHHQVIQQMMGRMSGGGTCTHPPLAEDMGEAMVESGMQEVETYVAHCQNNVMQYIMTSAIIDLCLAAVRRSGAQVSKRLWYQEGIDMEGVWDAEQVEEM